MWPAFRYTDILWLRKLGAGWQKEFDIEMKLTEGIFIFTFCVPACKDKAIGRIPWEVGEIDNV